MVDEKQNPYNIGTPEFKKIFYHLVLAAKKNSKIEKGFSVKEKQILSKKIEELETRKDPNDWIKAKLEDNKIIKPKTVVVRPTIMKPKNDNKKEIMEIKRHMEEVKRMYDSVKNRKDVDRERVMKLKNILDSLEKMLLQKTANSR